MTACCDARWRWLSDDNDALQSSTDEVRIQSLCNNIERLFTPQGLITPQLPDNLHLFPSSLVQFGLSVSLQHLFDPSHQPPP